MANIKFFIKPELNLPVFPLINYWIEYEYSGVRTRAEFAAFINNCLDRCETTIYPSTAIAYYNVASALFAMETNIAYETKAVELLVEKL